MNKDTAAPSDVQLQAAIKQAYGIWTALLEDGLHGSGVSVQWQYGELLKLAERYDLDTLWSEWPDFLKLFNEAALDAWKYCITYILTERLQKDKWPFAVMTAVDDLKDEIVNCHRFSLADIGMSQDGIEVIIAKAWKRSGYGAIANLKKDIKRNRGVFDPSKLLINQALNELSAAIYRGAVFDELSPEDTVLLEEAKQHLAARSKG